MNRLALISLTALSLFSCAHSPSSSLTNQQTSNQQTSSPGLETSRIPPKPDPGLGLLFTARPDPLTLKPGDPSADVDICVFDKDGNPFSPVRGNIYSIELTPPFGVDSTPQRLSFRSGSCATIPIEATTDALPGKYSAPISFIVTTGTASPRTFKTNANVNIVIEPSAPRPGMANLVINIDGLLQPTETVDPGLEITGPMGFKQTLTSSSKVLTVPAGTYTLDEPPGVLKVIGRSNTRLSDPRPDTAQSVTLAAGDTAYLSVQYNRQAFGTLNVKITGLEPGETLFNPVIITGPDGFSREVRTPSATFTAPVGSYRYSAPSRAYVSGNDYVELNLQPSLEFPIELREDGTEEISPRYARSYFGDLVVKINGLADGETLLKGPTITGPTAFNDSFIDPMMYKNYQIVERVPVGTYTLNTPPSVLRTQDPIVSTIYENPTPNTDQSTNVTTGKVSILSVNYSKRQGTGLLWVNNNNHLVSSIIDGYTANQLSTSLKESGAIRMQSPAQAEGYPAFTFSQSGDLWLSYIRFLLPIKKEAYLLSKFTPAKLSPSTNQSADIDISYVDVGLDPLLYTPKFDRSGNLWGVTTRRGKPVTRGTRIEVGVDQGMVVAIDSSDLSSTKSGYTYKVQVDVSMYSVIVIRNLDIDATGTLWILGNYSDGTYKTRLWKLSRAADIAPKTTIKLDSLPSFEFNYEFFAPSMAFDKIGNLWIATGDSAKFDQPNSKTIFRIPRSTLQSLASGTTSLYVSMLANIRGVNTKFYDELASFSGLTFDNSGFLWVRLWSSYPKLLRFNVEPDGTPLPIGSNNIAPVAEKVMPDPGALIPRVHPGPLAFNPSPCGLPPYPQPGC